MKKVIAVIVVVMMLVFAVGCSAGQTESTPEALESAEQTEETAEATEEAAEATEEDVTEEEPATTPELVEFKIGYPQAPIENITITSIHANREAIAEACGGTLNTEIFDFTPEGTIDAVEKMIQSGVQGVLVTPFAETIMPTISSMCEESGVYFILAMRKVSDPEIKEIIEANPYYLGAVYEDDYTAGYTLGKSLADAGATNICVVGTTEGDATGDARELGLAAAAEEFGMEILSEVRALAQASDATAAVESWLAAYPEMDGIVRIASTAAGDTVAIAAALEAAGKAGNVKYVTLDTEEGCEQYLENGTITMTLGDGLVNDSITATAILCNAVLGTPVSDTPVDILMSFPAITSLEDLENQSKYILTGESVYTDEEIRSELMKYFNDEVTVESIVELANAFSPSAIAERRAE